MTINDVDTSRKPKKLGFWMLTALVAGNMIGSGIFLLPSTLAQIGSITLYSWLFTSAGALFLTLVFVRLSVQIPKTGGPYAYAKEGLGHFIGFQTAYNYWLAVWIGNAGIVLALVGYLSVFWPSLAHPKTACIAAIAITWLLTFVNLAGVRSAGLVQLLTTVLKIIPLLIVGILGWFYIHPHYYFETINVTHPHQSNAMAIASGAALTFWSFIGLESATVPAGSVHNPKRNIPLATIFGFCVAALVYILSSTAIMGMIPNHVLQHSDAPFAEAGKIIFGTTGRIIITLGAVISCFGCLNGWILLQGQVAMAAADDKLFPKMFAQRNKHHVPAKGLIITSIFITALLLLTISKNLVAQFQLIILLAVLATLIPYFYTAIAELAILGKETKPHKLKSLIAILALLYSCWAIIGSGEKTIYYGCLVLLSSVPLYALWTKNNRRPDHAN